MRSTIRLLSLFAFLMALSWVSLAQEEAMELDSLNEPSTPETGTTQTPQKYSQRRDFVPKDSGVVLNLRSALEEGLRTNPNQIVRDYQTKLLELKWEDTFEKFWLPNMSLSFVASNQRIHHLMTGSLGGVQNNNTAQTPTGYIGLSFGEWTLFNWGKDYLDYQNDKATYVRQKEILTSQQRRELKYRIINHFFNLVRTKQLEKIYRNQLQHATFIYRLAREKASLRKISRQEFYQVRSLFLHTQNQFHEAKQLVVKADEAMALLLGHALDTNYRTNEILVFRKLELPLESAIASTLENYPEIKDKKLALDNSMRSYEKALKENLPLPKFSINLGTYTHAFGQGGSSTTFETLPGESDVELVASVNMVWPLTGENGLFNYRRNDSYLLKKKISEVEFYNSKREAEVMVRLLYQNVGHLETQHEVVQSQLENARKAFDVVLDNYVSGSASFLDFQNALNNLRVTETSMENIKFTHLERKVELANLMGVEDLPGVPFENLTLKEVAD